MDRVIKCQGCDKLMSEDQVIPLESVPDLLQRIAPGEVLPFGECPDLECGALCHEVGETSEEWIILFNKGERKMSEVDSNFAEIIERLLAVPEFGLEVSSALYAATKVVEACDPEELSTCPGGVMRREFPGSGATFRWDVVVDLLMIDGVNGHPPLNWQEMEKDTTGAREAAVAHVYRFLDRDSGELLEDAAPVVFWKVAA